MDAMEEVEESETVVATRRTRSGRSISSPSEVKKQPVGRRTRRKVVMIEVEVSDEEAERETQNALEDALASVLGATDNAVEASDIQDENNTYQEEAMDISDVAEPNNVQFEDSNSITNDFNSFKGAESSSDAINNESNSCFDVVQETTENGQDVLIASDNFDNEKLERNEEEDNGIEHMNSETDFASKQDEQPQEDDQQQEDDQKQEDPQDEEEPQEVEAQEDPRDEEPQEAKPQDEENEEIVKHDSSAEAKVLPSADPDAENISEDELPTVQAVKVPETEEVSDEELPGPKRAELPADTEVVSEEELETVKKESNKRKLTEGDYDPGSPTSENESAPKKQALEASDETDELKDKPKKLPELDKYWKAVNDDPTDFTGWTYLLQYVDQENDMEAAREAYDAFLSHYPYCYGYWRKYADYEKRKGNKKRCEEVFERGLKAIPLSVDLWIHYLTYVRTSKPDDEEFIRSQFERSLTSCGLEFRSDRLWENYIKWETDGKRLQNATLVYERLLSTPTQGYLQHFDNFQEHVLSNPPNKILEVDEFLALRKEVKNMLRQDAADVADNPDIPPGEDSEENTDEETKAIRERIISIRRKIHKNTSTSVTARWNYEEGIKRPYFHVKPLERCQLKNWQEYLDYEIAQGDKTRIIVLFERCLIACALYEEFWLKFVHYLQELKDDDLHQKIKDVYERACTIHHLKKPNVHLQWAMFEESIKNFNKAAEILQNLEKSVPNLLQVAYRRINLERRRGDHEKCCSLYEHYINNSKNKTFSTNLAIKYARFTLKIIRDADKALEILNLAITKDSNNPRLYLQLVDITMHKESVTEAEVLKHIDAFLEKESCDQDQKVMFAQRKLEFLEDFGTDIQSVQNAYDEYQKYLKSSRENSKKKDSKSDVSKKDKNAASTTSTSNSYSNYGNYGNSTTGNYQYGNSQQGAYGQYPQYGQGDQYQYSGWQYQGNYSGYNQWGGYGSGYSY